MSGQALITVLLVSWSVAVALIDWRRRKVPNNLLLLLLLPTVAVLLMTGEGPTKASAGGSLLGFAAGLAITLPGYWWSVLGAGDVKLAATMGLVQGWAATLLMLLIAAVLLGLMGLLAVMRAQHVEQGSAKVRLPAAVALAGGFAGVLLLQWGIRP